MVCSLPVEFVSPDREAMSPSSHPESSDSGYFLRYCSKYIGGLGLDPGQVPKGRGRKSFMAKAQSKEKKDLLEGKQQSIERVLRTVRAQKKGRR